MDNLDIKAGPTHKGHVAAVVALVGASVLSMVTTSQAFADIAKGGGPDQMAARTDAVKKISCPPGPTIVKDSLRWVDARALFDYKWYSADLQYACTNKGDGVTQLSVLTTMPPPSLPSQPRR